MIDRQKTDESSSNAYAVAWRADIKNRYLPQAKVFNPACEYNIGKLVREDHIPSLPNKLLEYPFRDYTGRCYNDHHDIPKENGGAVGCVIDYDESRKIFRVVPAFCNYHCAVTWGETSHTERTKKHCRFWIRMMIRRFNPKLYKELFILNNYVLHAAPTFHVLKPYGGKQTIEEYRQEAKLTPSLIYQVQVAQGNTKILPATWECWTMDKTVEVSQYEMTNFQSKTRTCALKQKNKQPKKKSRITIGTATATDIPNNDKEDRIEAKKRRLQETLALFKPKRIKK